MNRDQISLLLAAVCVGSLVLWIILFAVFGAVTVRRLRRHPEVREKMGYEFFPGCGIVNVAVALSWPRRIMHWLDTRAVLGLHANSETMYRHTSGLDRVLARAFYWTMVFGCLWVVFCGLVRRLWGLYS